MAIQLRDLWTREGTMRRGTYAAFGLILFAIKHNIDRAVALWAFDHAWYPWTYLLGVPSLSGRDPIHGTPALVATLLAISLPFIWLGVIMTIRRLRDAGWPLALVALFFVPFVNLLFFALLCVQPTREPPAPGEIGRSWIGRILKTDNVALAAALGVIASTLLGVLLTAFSTSYLRHYGWGLFVGIPFMMGLTSVLFYAAARPRAWFECVSVAALSVGLASLLILATAIEGFLCVMMAAPIAALLAVLGSLVGYWIQIERWSHRLDQVRLYAAAWVALPALMATEAGSPPQAPLLSVTTTCEVDAPPDAVWRNVISFGEIPPPTEAMFNAGIAYPVRARLDGHGVGAVRHCEFSTGSFVEPITAWDENRRLAFDVASQPHPMREWSPYANLEPAHLEGFFRSRRGEFLLTPIDGGRRTRLDGTTWYEQELWPNTYWRVWSDHLVHTIHNRVLDHIKARAERTPRPHIPPE